VKILRLKKFDTPEKTALFLQTKTFIFAGCKSRKKTFALWKINVRLTWRPSVGALHKPPTRRQPISNPLLFTVLKHFRFRQPRSLASFSMVWKTENQCG
jgi:hypothetical protein